MPNHTFKVVNFDLELILFWEKNLNGFSEDIVILLLFVCLLFFIFVFLNWCLYSLVYFEIIGSSQVSELFIVFISLFNMTYEFWISVWIVFFLCMDRLSRYNTVKVSQNTNTDLNHVVGSLSGQIFVRFNFAMSKNRVSWGLNSANFGRF